MADQTPGKFDPFEFLKFFWAQMQAPGFGSAGAARGSAADDMTPTLFSAEKIEKRLNQLKQIESWLSMNLSMLQMQIKTLEMQQAGLSAMRSAASVVGTAPAEAGAQRSANSLEANPFLNPTAWMDLMQAQMQVWKNAVGAGAASGRSVANRKKK